MLSLGKKNDLKPEVRKSRDPFYNMMYSLLTEKIERKKMPTVLARNNSHRLFLAECPHRRHGRNLFSCPEQWNPYFPLSWQTTSLSQEDSTEDSHTQ